MKAFADRLDRFVTFVGMAGGWLLFLLAAVVCFDVTTRKFFVFQSTLLQEMEWHIHTVIFFLALGMTYLRGSHVRIDIFRDKMSERARAKLELFGMLFLMLPFTFLLFRYGIDFVMQSYAQNEGSVSMQGIHHRWIIKSIIPTAMVLLFLALGATLIRIVLYLKGLAPAPEAFARKELPAVHSETEAA